MDILIADVIGDVALVLVVSSLLGALARRWGSHGSSARYWRASCSAQASWAACLVI
jgi:hypothetical protein